MTYTLPKLRLSKRGATWTRRPIYFCAKPRYKVRRRWLLQLGVPSAPHIGAGITCISESRSKDAAPHASFTPMATHLPLCMGRLSAMHSILPRTAIPRNAPMVACRALHASRVPLRPNRPAPAPSFQNESPLPRALTCYAPEELDKSFIGMSGGQILSLIHI